MSHSERVARDYEIAHARDLQHRVKKAFLTDDIVKSKVEFLEIDKDLGINR